MGIFNITFHYKKEPYLIATLGLGLRYQHYISDGDFSEAYGGIPSGSFDSKAHRIAFFLSSRFFLNQRFSLGVLYGFDLWKSMNIRQKWIRSVEWFRVYRVFRSVGCRARLQIYFSFTGKAGDGDEHPPI